MGDLNNPTIRGTKAIAHELGCSRRTVARLAADGKLPVKKGFSGGKTSPLITDRKSLDSFKNTHRD